jgi:hypothetical protein
MNCIQQFLVTKGFGQKLNRAFFRGMIEMPAVTMAPEMRT